MSDLTPAQLALELGTTAKRVRAVLRREYGVLPDDTTRWSLAPEQEAHVRRALGGGAGADSPEAWALEPGDRAQRRDVHNRYGGSRQNGIVTLPGRDDILIFSSSTGSSHGYAMHEGYQEDGSFWYTGEGQHGDQEFSRGNRALRDSARDGKRIRLFTVEKTWATYVGEFTTGEPTYRIETIPDTSGAPRKGIIFHLEPVIAEMTLLASGEEDRYEPAQVLSWYPPDASDIVIAQTEELPPGDRIASRIEMQLQADFGEWSAARGDAPARLRLASDGTSIEPDLYFEKRRYIVEAKRSISRHHVRTAIGQVLDYAHVAARHGINANPMVLLPGRAASDLMDLLASLGIAVAYRVDEGFEIVEARERY